MGLLNVCVNPFIYATKYDVVKKKLRKFIARGQVSPASASASQPTTDKRSSKK